MRTKMMAIVVERKLARMDGKIMFDAFLLPAAVISPIIDVGKS